LKRSANGNYGLLQLVFQVLLLIVLVGVSSCLGQSTQALIVGRITDRLTGKKIPNAKVDYESDSTRTSGTRKVDENGIYTLPLLPPGTYRLTATAGEDYQPLRYESIAVPVAAALDIDFALRRLTDIFDKNLFRSVPTGHLLNFYGPDVDTSRAVLVESLQIGEGRLESSISDVIDPGQIENLPFAGRDIYAALLFQPGVTADPVALRGLGISVNGQRPSSSDFLLDGVENNNPLITGPLTTLAPEAVQEYRVSTNNFSAEYGGTSGYLANAITRSGGPGFHGILYGNLANDFLNANGFQENLNGYPRPAFKELQPGFRLGGPLWRQLIFVSGSFEYTRLRTTQDPQTWYLPSASILAQPTATESQALLQQYHAIVAPAGPAANPVAVSLIAPSSLNQYLGSFRLDRQSRDGTRHFFFRVVGSDFDRPDFYWTPYPAFVSGFDLSALSIAASYISDLRPHVVNEIRIAWNLDGLRIDDNNHGLPKLATSGATLPGSTSPYAFQNTGRTWQALDNLTITHGSHTLKMGGGVSWRLIGGALRNGADGEYQFSSYSDFLQDSPVLYQLSVAQPITATAPLALPNYDRSYRYGHYSGFAQDSWRVGERLMLSFGLRYEVFGPPENVGTQKDYLIALGPGDSLPNELVGAHWAPLPQGNQALYSTDTNDWAPRFGFSWTPYRKAPFLVHGSYGIFHDHPFDNLWMTIQNNAIALGGAQLNETPIDYLKLAQAGIGSFPGLIPDSGVPQPTIFQPSLRNPRIQSAFIGIQSRLTDALTFEVNGTASRGRGLLTTDFVNRALSEPISPSNIFGRFAPGLPVLSYIANQGFSNNDGVTALLRMHSTRVQGQIAYTWSHTIDNQSDPLGGNDSLEATSVVAGGSPYGRAAFVQQFNSLSGVGNADFDQRSSLVFSAIAPLPAPHGWLARLFSGWQIAITGALRSGLPFTAYVLTPFDPTQPELIENRANLVQSTSVILNLPVPGGVQILNPAAFAVPGAGHIGSSGRNAFAGPGTITADLSISRTFLFRSHESMRVVLRADAFNFLNHANLYVNFENPTLGQPGFGTARYGTSGIPSNFPLQVPFAETARQIQLMARFQF
jgi:hypothetical protein